MVSREEVASYRGFCTFKSVGCICMKLLCLLQRGVSLRIPWVTGVQALERNYPDLPMLPGHVLRREFEYIRHGTLSWFINWDVVSGQVIEPSWGQHGRKRMPSHISSAWWQATPKRRSGTSSWTI